MYRPCQRGFVSGGRLIFLREIMIKKIISGGQTGADQAALDAAIKYGFPHGGWIPKGRKTEDGILPDKYKLKEMPTGSYQKRTEQNVIDSDGTVIISHGKLTGGSKLTQKIAKKHDQPCLHIDLNETPAFITASTINSWIIENKIEVLNIAGPRASKDPKIYKDTSYIVEGIILLGMVYAQSGSLLTDHDKDEYLEDVRTDVIDQIIDEIIAILPLKEKVSFANMSEEDIEILQRVFDLYIRSKIGFQNEDEYTVIINLLWKKLQETHKLRMIK